MGSNFGLKKTAKVFPTAFSISFESGYNLMSPLNQEIGTGDLLQSILQ